jgi:hypothetical protein
MIVDKITIGFVIQRFDTDSQRFISQEFVGSDQVDYEIDGDSIDYEDFEDLLDSHSGYFPFEMVQPDYSNILIT